MQTQIQRNSYYEDKTIIDKEKIKKYGREYRKRPNVKNRIKVYAKKYKEKIGKEYYRDIARKFRKDNPRYGKEKKKEYYKKNKNSILKKVGEYYQRNRENKIEKQKEYQRKNKDKIKIRMSNYIKKRKKVDLGFAISMRLRSLVSHAFKKYSKTGKIMVARKYGINYGAIIEHLKPFPENLSEYHIDHIRPLCSFDLIDFEQIKEAFAPENHQWLLAKENLSKGGRIK